MMQSNGVSKIILVMLINAIIAIDAQVFVKPDASSNDLLEYLAYYAGPLFVVQLSVILGKNLRLMTGLTIMAMLCCAYSNFLHYSTNDPTLGVVFMLNVLGYWVAGLIALTGLTDQAGDTVNRKVTNALRFNKK